MALTIRLCYNQKTRKVAFAEVPREFPLLLHELMSCSMADMLRLLSLKDGNIDEHSGSFAVLDVLNFAQKLGASSQAKVSGKGPPCFSPELSALLGLSNSVPAAKAYIPSPAKACTLFRRCVATAYWCWTDWGAIFLAISASKGCPLCVHMPCSPATPCTPVPVTVLCSPGKDSLDPCQPIYRCTNYQCMTYSNIRLAPCTVCKGGAMGRNVVILNNEGNVEPANWEHAP